MICGQQSGTKTDTPQSTLVFPNQHQYIKASYSYFIHLSLKLHISATKSVTN